MLLITAYLLTAVITGHSDRFSVDMRAPHVHLIERADLRTQCRTADPVDGCTEFLGEILRCDCRRDGAQWHIEAHAQLMPYVYVLSPRFAAHENLHLLDLQQQLSVYLDDLTSRAYADESVCKRTASFEAAVFNMRMDVLRADSNARLH